MVSTRISGARAVVFLAVVLSGCAGQSHPMNPSELNDFADRYAAAWSGQDAARFATFYAENGSIRVNDGEPAVGREAIAALAQSYMTALPNMIVRLDSLTIVNGKPHFNWTLLATNSGPGGNGNRIDISGYEEWTMSPEGLIEESLGHMDSEEYQRQIEFGAPEE